MALIKEQHSRKNNMCVLLQVLVMSYGFHDHAPLNSSLLAYAGKHVPGVTVPALHVGMLFTSFCWRLQQHLLYNANYRHWGKPVQWYGVPAACSEAMTDAFARALATEAASQPGVLWSPATLLDPALLQSQGVAVYSVRGGVYCMCIACFLHVLLDI